MEPEQGKYICSVKLYTRYKPHLRNLQRVLKTTSVTCMQRIITHELELNDSVLAYEASDIIISTMSSLDWFTFSLSMFWWENLYIAAHDSSSDFLKVRTNNSVIND